MISMMFIKEKCEHAAQKKFKTRVPFKAGPVLLSLGRRRRERREEIFVKEIKKDTVRRIL